MKSAKQIFLGGMLAAVMAIAPCIGGKMNGGPAPG
jgi:hypothetical protein